MKDYVAIARKTASLKREKEEVSRKKERSESERRLNRIDEIRNLLKVHLKKWCKVKGFAYEDKGDTCYQNCAVLYRNGSPCLGFKCSWKSWVARYSDECAEDVEGACITVEFFDEYYNSFHKEQDFTSPYEPEGLVDACMGSVSEYLSKFM